MSNNVLYLWKTEKLDKETIIAINNREQLTHIYIVQELHRTVIQTIVISGLYTGYIQAGIKSMSVYIKYLCLYVYL